MKPGDKVEVVGSKCMPADDARFVGMRGVVVENDPYVTFVVMLVWGGKHDIVTVDVDGGMFGGRMRLVCCSTALRKIDDYDSPTWDGIEKLTGWKRPAVPA